MVTTTGSDEHLQVSVPPAKFADPGLDALIDGRMN